MREFYVENSTNADVYLWPTSLASTWIARHEDKHRVKVASVTRLRALRRKRKSCDRRWKSVSGPVPLEENVDFDVDGWTKLASGNYHRCSLIGCRVLSRARSHDQASIADLDTMKSDELDGKRKTKVDLLFGMCRDFCHTCTTR